MAAAYNPKMVTDGLVLALDAANPKSFNSAENLMTSSEDMSAWGAVNVTYETDVIIAPNGTLTADAVIASAANVGHYFSRSTSVTLLDNTVYTFSIYVKHKGFDALYFQPIFKDGTYQHIANWNLSTKVANNVNSGLGATITELANGWFRITSTFNSKTGGSSMQPVIYIGTYGNILGDGIKGVYAWGAQVNRGSSALPYARTTATAITQSTTWNDLSGRGNNGTLVNGPTYNTTNSGTFIFDGTDDWIDCGNADIFSPPRLTASILVRCASFSTRPHLFGRGNGSSGNFYMVVETNGTFNFFNDIGANWIVAAATPAFALNTWTYVTVTHDGNSSKIYYNGTLQVSNSRVGDLRNWQSNTLQIGSLVNGGQLINGSVSLVHLYNRALSATEIQQNYTAIRGRYGI